MADGTVGLPPDSTGKKVRTIETTVGANTVEQQVVTLADASGTVDNAGVKVGDGANVVEGSTSDVALTADGSGTMSAKLRGLVKILGSTWDAVNGRLKVDGSGVTQPVSFPAGTAVPVRGESDVFNQILMELRKVRFALEIQINQQVNDQDVEVR